MKIEILKAIVFILIGAFLYSQTQKPEVKTIKEYVEKKVGTVKRVIVDGSKRIDETESYVSDSKQNEISVISAPQKKHRISYIPKYNFDSSKFYHSVSYSYKNVGLYISENKEAGLVLSFEF